MLKSLMAVVLTATVAFATSLPQGGYAVSGAVNGTAAMSAPGVGGQTGQMTTNEFGTDNLWYNPATGEYEIFDGQTGQKVAEMVVHGGGPVGEPPHYKVDYFDAAGNPAGAGTWTPA